MAPNNIFRQESIDSISSPEQLDLYLKVVKPKVWLTLVAVLLLFIALLVWALTGSIRSTFPIQGVQEDDTFFGYIMPRDALELEPGMNVVFPGEVRGVIAEISYDVQSEQEVIEALDNSYIVSQLDLNEWNIRVTIDSAESTETLKAAVAQVVIEDIKPISFLFGG